MSFTNIVSLLGGLGAFLFGMKYMSDGLELAAGQRMKDLLERLTRNRFLGFLLGVLVTVVIQSSSATTVMVMGFINAGIMDLAQATGVIFGANIGTTITSVLIALDVSAIAPFCIFVGAFLMLYGKKKQYRHIGQVILGFGFLFQGLHTMSSSMSPLQDVEWFQNFIMNARNPIVGLLAGIVMCAIIQSSSAAVGIVQVLAMEGLMPLYFSSFLICGINIGSAAPTILSSLNARNNAKRASCIYLIYNIVGAIIFVPVTILFPYTQLVESLIPNPMFQVSVLHIIFKIVSAIILLPLTNQVVKLTYRIIPKQTHEDAQRLMYIDVNLVSASSAIMVQIRKEVDRMASLVYDNLNMSINSLLNRDLSDKKTINNNEEVIDYLVGAISDYLLSLNVIEMSTEESRYTTRVYQALNDLERTGDYALILSNLAEKCVEENLTFSEAAQGEISRIYATAQELYEGSVRDFYSQDANRERLLHLNRLQREVSVQVKMAQAAHMERMRTGQCKAATGAVFFEILNSLDRIGGHSINIEEASLDPAIHTAAREFLKNRINTDNTEDQ